MLPAAEPSAVPARDPAALPEAAATSVEELRREAEPFREAIRTAFEPRRLRRIAEEALGRPVLVVTVGGVGRALARGDHDDRAARLALAMEEDQAGPDAGGRMPVACRDEQVARQVLGDLRDYVGNGGSCARPGTEAVLVNDSGRMGFGFGAFRGIDRSTTADSLSRFTTLHETGHVAEHVHGWRVPHEAGTNYRRHLSECYADAFAVAAMVAAGADPDEALGLWAEGRYWLLDLGKAGRHPDELPGRTPLAAYLSVRPVSAAASLARPGMAPDAVAGIALAARAGAMDPEELKRALAGDLPSWFADHPLRALLDPVREAEVRFDASFADAPRAEPVPASYAAECPAEEILGFAAWSAAMTVRGSDIPSGSYRAENRRIAERLHRAVFSPRPRRHPFSCERDRDIGSRSLIESWYAVGEPEAA